MALDWETYKSSLGCSSNTPLFYFDEEGSKISIDSDCEFQEALRLAKLGKINLKFFFDTEKLKANDIMHVDQCQPMQSASNPYQAKRSESIEKNSSAVSQNYSPVEYACTCHTAVAPEWFTHYMKKFKKEVVHELKSYIHDTVHSAIEEKFSYTKSEMADLLSERNKPMTCAEFFDLPLTNSKKKKKTAERDLMDSDQRQIRLPKKLNAIKPDRLEKLDQKTKALEEKRRLLESKHHSKSKSDKKGFGMTVKDFFRKQSASFPKNEIYLTLQPESEFAVMVNIQNDGLYQWSSPELVCFELKGVSLCLWDYTKKLPKLFPNGNCSVVVRGKLSPDECPRYFKCKVVDLKVENISPVFTCRFEVAPKKSVKESDEVVAELRDTVGTLIDFEKDLIANSQKKIEENINEIERRLLDIDLLQTSGIGKEVKAGNVFQTGCDLIQLDSRLLQEDIQNDFEATSGLCNLEKDGQEGENEKEASRNVDKMKKNGELESSDSELSIVFMSDEEEENFFLVHSESLSFPGFVNEDENQPSTESKFTEQPTSTKQQSPEPKVKMDFSRESSREQTTPSETIRQSPTRCRCSPFGEEISKPKKMKSKSTEYRFTAANLTQPTFKQTRGGSMGRTPRFTFTGEKDKQSKGVKSGIPETDALGRVIYAVSSNGRCLPVRELLESEEESHCNQFEGSQGSQNHQERHHDRPDDVPTVNTLPNALIRASNVASLAFNTAKYVINNLQSAFVTEGKTEMGTPAYEDRVKPSMDALFKLYRMGYMDIERNRTLLAFHNNDLNAVLDELVRLYENPSERTS